MEVVFALVLAAATPVVAVANAAPNQERGIKVSAVATAQILRAETSSPDPGPQATTRQVRPQADKRTVLIEFY